MNLIDEYKTNLALNLFKSLSVGYTPEPKYEIPMKYINKKCTTKGSIYPDRQLLLLQIIKLIGTPINSKQRYIIAMAYAWSRVQYRSEAIKFINLYLDNPLYEGAYKNIKHPFCHSQEEERKYHIYDMQNYLAEAYIGLYDFDNALLTYEKMIEIFPSIPIAYFGKTETLTKLNRLEDCYNWLITIRKQSPYYKVETRITELGQKIKDDWFYNSINKLINETNEKIMKGYKYKPRKKNG